MIDFGKFEEELPSKVKPVKKLVTNSMDVFVRF